MKSQRNTAALRLLYKAEVLEIAGVSYPTLWAWMCAGKFPRPRVTSGGSNSKNAWRSDEVERWIAELPVRRLKGDAETALKPTPRSADRPRKAAERRVEA
jgi:predicted DNA-binding transcriptional regulator AlpA